MTPKVPPGFEHTLSQVAAPVHEEQLGRPSSTHAHAVIAPVLPEVPLSVVQRSTTPNAKFHRDPEDIKSAGTGADRTPKHLKESSSVIDRFRSNGFDDDDEVIESRITSTGKSIRTDSVKEVLVDAQPPTIVNLIKGEAQSSSSSLSKLEIPAATIFNVPEPSSAKTTSSVLDDVVVPTTSNAVQSRSGTPTTTSSEVLRSSVPAPRPRTIRLTTSMIQKAEAASITSPSTDKPITLPSITQNRQGRSRQPSLSSISRSRPSTPAMSERFTSRDVSRAGSPPPASIVGSASARIKSKSQTKKDRKEKAKRTEVTEPVAAAIVPAVEQVGPIIARQKKQKKKSVSTSDGAIRQSELGVEPGRSSQQIDPAPGRDLEQPENPPSPDEVDGPKDSTTVEDLVAASVDDPLEEEEESRQSYRVKDLCNDAARMSSEPNAIHKLLDTKMTPMSKLMSEMLSNGDISRDHPWLSNASFNSAAYRLPADSRRGQDYLDGNGYSAGDAFGYVYLPQKEKRALYAGHAVSVADTGDRKNDLLRRCLISPNGWVMRHLSMQESERVLELEERRSVYVEEFGELGIMNGLGVLEADDFINLSGGIEELGRFGDRHGVCWVVSDDQQDDDSGDNVGGASYDDFDDDDILAGHDALSDVTDDDLGLDLGGDSADHQLAEKNAEGGSMPGAWDPAFNASATNDAGPNTLPPIASHPAMAKLVNLRAMDSDALQSRIREKQKEVDTFRRDVDKAEKAMAKKNREFTRWRDSVLKV